VTTPGFATRAIVRIAAAVIVPLTGILTITAMTEPVSHLRPAARYSVRVNEGDEAAKATLTGILSLNSRKQFIITVPTFVKVGGDEVQVGVHDWPLLFPKSITPTDLLIGQNVTVAGYWFENGQLFVVEISRDGKSPPTAKKEESKKDGKKGKATDLYGDK
jgi:hypothetical protein